MIRRDFLKLFILLPAVFTTLRDVRPRCQFAHCNRAVTVPNPNDVHSYGPFCRYHNKTLNFARMYGYRGSPLNL